MNLLSSILGLFLSLAFIGHSKAQCVEPASNFMNLGVERCVENVNATQFIAALSTATSADSKCASLTEYIKSEEGKQFTNDFQLEANITDFSNADYASTIAKVLSIPNSDYVKYCDVMTTKVMPCFESIAGSFATTLSSLSSGCCDEAMASATKHLGSSLEEFAMKVMSLSVDVVCATRQTDSKITNEQTCGYTMVQSLVSSNMLTMITNMMEFVQIPNDQACSAFSGEPYTNTFMKSVTLSPEKPIGSCGRQLDSMFSFMKDMPIVSSTDVAGGALVKAFNNEECLSMTELQSNFAESNSSSSSPIGTSQGLCINLPNGFSEKCSSFGSSGAGIYSSSALLSSSLILFALILEWF